MISGKLVRRTDNLGEASRRPGYFGKGRWIDRCVFMGYKSPLTHYFLGGDLETFHIFGDVFFGSKGRVLLGKLRNPPLRDIFQPEDPIVLSYYVTE